MGQWRPAPTLVSPDQAIHRNWRALSSTRQFCLCVVGSFFFVGIPLLWLLALVHRVFFPVRSSFAAKMSHFNYENIEMQQSQYYSQQQTFVQPWQHQRNGHYHDNKTISAVTVQQQSSDYYNGNDGQNFSDQSALWKPGFWRRLPYLSMFSLLATLFCKTHKGLLYSEGIYSHCKGIVAALYVLLASDGMPIDKWGYGVAPAVYLAIISVITNVFLSFALVNGLVISFWRMALKGCTVSTM